MRFKDLTKKVAQEAGITVTAADKIIKALTSVIVTSLGEGDKVQIPKIGVFKVEAKKQRSARNPKTGETITIPARNKTIFRPSSSLSERINKRI